MSINRRTFIAGLGGLMVSSLAHAHKDERQHWHRHRPADQRVVRRRAEWRMVNGRRRLVVPVNVAAGWELVVDQHVVVVREVQPDHVLLEHADGRLQRIASLKQDTPQNARTVAG